VAIAGWSIPPLVPQHQQVYVQESGLTDKRPYLLCMLCHWDEALLISNGLTGLVWGGGGLGITCRGVVITGQEMSGVRCEDNDSTLKCALDVSSHGGDQHCVANMWHTNSRPCTIWLPPKECIGNYPQHPAESARVSISKPSMQCNKTAGRPTG
jgi:hypothetical protein